MWNKVVIDLIRIASRGSAIWDFEWPRRLTRFSGLERSIVPILLHPASFL